MSTLNCNYEDLFKMAVNGTLSKDFNRWDICNEDGWTVAHEAALYGNLPESFDRWSLADKNGLVVVYAAAFMCTLPKDFHLTHPEHWNSVLSTGLILKDVAILNGYKIKE